MLVAIHKHEVDATGAPATLNTERLALGTPVYAWIPFR